MNKVRMLSVVNRTVGRGWFPRHRNSLQTCRRCIVAEAFASGTCENERCKAQSLLVKQTSPSTIWVAYGGGFHSRLRSLAESLCRWRGGGAIRFDITQFSQTPPTKRRGQSTTDVVRASWRSPGADNLPEGPLKSRTVVMRDERVGRCPAVSGLTQPWLEHCPFYSPEFANLEEDTRNRVNTVSQSGGMTGVPKPSLDVSVSQKGRTRRAGLQNVGKHCSGTGRNLFGSPLNLDRAGVQSPDTPGLTGHVQTVLVTCRHVLGRGRGCPQGGNAPSSDYLLP
jgi:hypothetical protein